jgi:mannitol/fructose-specific phosphotransferase system IIA component (Ntr-type)
MERIRLSDIIGEENVSVALPASERRAVLEELVRLLRVDDDAKREEILSAVLSREEIQTTGIGYGIAIPHGKAGIEPSILASVGISAEPVDYGSVDGEPVRIFILMVSRLDVTGPHVQALAHVARLLGHGSFREALLACTEPSEVLDLIREEEKVEE